MQIINRIKIKTNAKAKALDRSLGLASIAVMYIVLTNGISDLLHFFIKSPMTEVAEQFYTVVRDIAGNPQASPDVGPAYAAAGRMIQEMLGQPQKQALLFGFLLLYLYQQVVGFGFHAVCLRINRGEELEWVNLFDVLWMSGKILFLTLGTYLLTYCGVMFFVLPGLLALYGFRAAPLILVDHPEWSALRCMTESFRLTSGYKLQLFWLDVSFIGWDAMCYILMNMGYDMGTLIHPLTGVVLSLALYSLVASIYLPYKSISIAEYYEIMKVSAPAEQDGKM